MEEEKRSETSPRPSQPTPFSIADILSRRTSHGEHDKRSMVVETTDEIGQTTAVSESVKRITFESRDINGIREIERERLLVTGAFPRLPSPDANMARELDILRRNLAHANLSSFGGLPHLAQTSFKHLETLGNLPAYQATKEPRESSQRQQQDEALDMSKSKYLGKYYIKYYIFYYLYRPKTERKLYTSGMSIVVKYKNKKNKKMKKD